MTPDTGQKALAEKGLSGYPVSRYTRFVRSTKLGLGVFSLVLIGLVLFYPIFRQQEGGVRISFTTTSKKEPAQTSMKSPRFHGFDKDNQPYSMTSKTVTQISEDVMILDEPNGEIIVKGGQKLTVAAQTGEFDKKQHALKLKGNIVMQSDQGYVLTTDTLLVDISSKSGVTSSQVNGKGPLGTLKAYGGAMADGNNQQIVFVGPVFVVLNMDSEKKETPGSK